MSSKTLPCFPFPCAMGSEVHFLSWFHLVFHCMLLHWNTNISSGLGTCWRTHPNPYLGAHILCLDPMLCCYEDAVMVQIEPKLYLQPDKPGCIYTLPRGLEPQHSQFLHVNQTPHVVFNQRRAETRMFWWENELSTLAPPSGKCSSLSVCRTQDFCLPIDF